MKTTKKIIVGLLAAVLLCITVAGFAGCGNVGELTELQKNIQELKTLVSEQTKKIEELKGENERLQETVENLEIKSTRGVFHTLEEAYNFSLLSLDELSDIAEIQNNIDNTEKPKLDEKSERKIREAYAFLLRQEKSSEGVYCCPNAVADDVYIDSYYGRFYGNDVVMISDRYHFYTAAIECVEICGINFIYSDGRRISVFLQTN